MNSTLTGLLIVIILALGAWLIYSTHQTAVYQYTAADNLGTYPYVCDNGSAFTLSPRKGLTSVEVYANAQGMFTGSTTLTETSGTKYAGTAPDGQSVALLGDGETVHLTVGSAEAVCNPKADSENAPWNWGDATTTAQ